MIGDLRKEINDIRIRSEVMEKEITGLKTEMSNIQEGKCKKQEGWIGIKKGTLESYMSSLKKIASMGIDMIEIDDDYDIDRILDAFDENDTLPNSVGVYLSALVWWLRETQPNSRLIDKLREEIKVTIHAIESFKKENSLTEREVENFVNWPIILKVHENLKELAAQKNDHNHDLDYLLLSLYTCKEPVRIKDYSRMYITDQHAVYDVDKNYYVVSEKKFVINRYKTKKFYGTETFEISDNLDEIIRSYIAKYGLKSGDTLLGMSDSGFIMRLQNIFKIYIGKRISASLLRHIYITHQDQIGNLKTVKQKEDLAKKMGHNMMTQAKYYRHIDPDDLKFNTRINNTSTLHNRRGRPKKYQTVEEAEAAKNSYIKEWKDLNKEKLRQYRKEWKKQRKQQSDKEND